MVVSRPTSLQSIGVSQVKDKPNVPQSFDLRPTILKRTEQDFIGATLEELKRGGVAALTGTLPAAPGTVQMLLQPVHRTFYLSVLEVVCNPYDLPVLQPRLDPRKIDSAGLVVRRLDPDAPRRQGWRKQGAALKGWISFASEQEEDLDPDPARRPPTLTAGHPEIDRLLVPAANTLTETVSPLFVAPPDVSEAAGRTILYGVIPVSSPERSESPDPATYDLDFVRTHLVDFLRPAGLRSIPRANQRLYASNANNLDDRNLDDRNLQRFILMLRQLMFELGAFSDFAPGKAVLDLLNQLNVTYNEDTPTQPAGQFLQQAANVLAAGDPDKSVKMPKEWPAISPEWGDRLLQLAKTALDARLATAQPQVGRFDDLTAQYQVRAFVRVKRPDGCPPELFWSKYSNPFTIAPWYENSGLPPIQVALPNVLDGIKNLKPGVAFAVPPQLFDFLQKNDPKELLKGNGNGGDGSGIAWICSFNIPIITLCAFIVLNIFLQLFNLIFQWLFFIKICIPIPKKN